MKYVILLALTAAGLIAAEAAVLALGGVTG